MTETYNDLHRAQQNEVSASSAGGAPFLICYGLTLIITGILAFNLPKETSALIAMFQGGVALPFLIVVYNIDPAQIPVVMAGLGGVHFFPYAWLHRTRIYIFLGAVIALGAFALVLFLKSASYAYILLRGGNPIGDAAPLVYRHAKAIVTANPQ